MQYEFLTNNPLLNKVYGVRNIIDKDEIDTSMKGLLPISSLTQVDDLAAKLLSFVKAGKRIVIVADYDCDGATSCAVMVRMLMSLKANVGWLVPDRSIHGYGLTTKIVDEAYQGIVTGDIQNLEKIETFVKDNAMLLASGEMELLRDVLKESRENVLKTSTSNITSLKPDVILTVDNGIASVEGVNYARSLGIDVLVTDHHLAGKELPNANAIVNPNHPDCTFKSKALCGVGVAWYVCVKLSQLAKADGLNPMPAVDLLPLVALGTVADVVSLDKNNRILVDNGLKLFRKTPSFVGLNKLLDFANINKERFCSTDIGFQIGPRINAAGRIKNMGIGILNLITDDPVVAYITAAQLNYLNELRKEITKQVTSEGEHILALSENHDYSKDYVVVLYPQSEDEEWHEGVIGIVAGRLKEKLNKPSIVMTYLEDEHLYKGSCRSIPSLHFKDLLDEVANADPDIFAKYGGHAMAAGLSVHADKIKDFVRIINELAKKKLNEADFKKYKITDGSVRLDELSVDYVDDMQKAIWGQNFPYPQFHGKFTVMRVRRMGANEEHVKLTFRSGRFFVDAVRFNCPDWQVKQGDEVSILFQPVINEWNDTLNVNLLIQDADFNVGELIHLEDIDKIQQQIAEEKRAEIVFAYQDSELDNNTIPDFD